MPISALELSAVLKFSLTKVVADWPDIEQGENQIAFALPPDTVDITKWSQAFAAVYALDPTDTATIDLRSFTNLADEAVVLTKVLAIAVQVVATVSTAAGGALTLLPGASNPFSGFLTSATEGLLLPAETGAVLTGAADFAGHTVDGTHKEIDLENTGTDAITVTVIIIGSTA